MCELFEPAAIQSGVKLEFVVDEKLPADLMGDSARLQQVLGNFLGNAFKFTDHGHIHVEAHALPGHGASQCRVLFQVSDTGIGIPGEQLDKLFKAFTQLDEGMTRKYQGAGLGLSICKHLVGCMGGNISVESEPGRGTSIYFCLPFDLAEQPPEEQAEKPHKPGAMVKRVLLAEDDRVNQLSVTRLLARQGVDVTAVSNGVEALAVLATQDFNVVLMDIQMPVMDGIEAARTIRDGQAGEKNRAIPIVALTAYAMVGDRERLLSAGMDDYVAKPVEIAGLLAAINRVVKSEK